MNGRVYDPLVSRFLSPDLFVQAPGNPQSFNRYAYVFNNPLSHTDPSGYIGIPQQWSESPVQEVDNSWFWMNHNLGNHGFGGGGHWSHQTNPKGFNFGFLGPSAFDRLYGPGSFLKMLQAESLAGYQADGLSVNASSIGYFFEALKAGFQFYILGAYGRESLVYSLGDIGKIILGEGGAITFTNRTASVHLDVAEVYLSGGGGGILNGIQTGLDVLGLIPGVGEFFDGANALIYLARGEYVNAGLSGAACIPFAGWAATGGKLAKKSFTVYQGVDKTTGVVKYVGITSREVTQRAAEHAGKGDAWKVLDFRPVPEALNLDRTGARILEQSMINQYGLPNLYNQINSISPKYWSIYGIY